MIYNYSSATSLAHALINSGLDYSKNLLQRFFRLVVKSPSSKLAPLGAILSFYN